MDRSHPDRCLDQWAFASLSRGHRGFFRQLLHFMFNLIADLFTQVYCSIISMSVSLVLIKTFFFGQLRSRCTWYTHAGSAVSGSAYCDRVPRHCDGRLIRASPSRAVCMEQQFLPISRRCRSSRCCKSERVIRNQQRSRTLREWTLD